MTSFILRTEDGDDLGFLGFADHEGDWPPAGPIDCVFMACHWATSPDDPRVRFVAEHKAREWAADVSYAETEMCVRIPLETGWVFELRSGRGGNAWEAKGPDHDLRGTGQFL